MAERPRTSLHLGDMLVCGGLGDMLVCGGPGAESHDPEAVALVQSASLQHCEYGVGVVQLRGLAECEATQ